MPNDELIHPEQPRFIFPVWVWAVTLFVFFGIIAAIVFGIMSRGSSYEETRAQSRAEKLQKAQEDWKKSLRTYGWVDKGKGVVHIPIDRAMELTVNQLRAKKVSVAGPIETPASTPVSATGAAQPSVAPQETPATKATPAPVSIEGLNSEIRGQPAAAANPPNAPRGTQPGPSTTPAAGLNSRSGLPPVSPTNTPVQHAPGTPLPIRGLTTPAPKASPTPP